MAILISVGAPVRQLVLGGTNTLSMPSTTIAYVVDVGNNVTMDSTTGSLSLSGTNILGSPATLPSSLIPTTYVADLLGRTTLSGAVRITAQGTGRMQLTDDFGTRSRIQLVGAN